MDLGWRHLPGAAGHGEGKYNRLQTLRSSAVGALKHSLKETNVRLKSVLGLDFMPGPNGLCKNCTQLDLNKLIFSEELTRGLQLGSVFSIKRTARDCGLCWLVIRHIQKLKLTFDGLPDSKIKCTLDGSQYGYQALNVEGERKRIINHFYIHFKSTQEDPPYTETSYLTPLTLRPCSYPLPKIEDFYDSKGTDLHPRPFGARTLRPNFDIALLRTWQATCKNCHSSKCESPEWLGENEYPRKLRLIDVIDMCVVDAPINYSYFALSYVWGQDNSRQSTLTKATINATAKFGGIGPKQYNLPKTVSDAVRLTREIGERYLWVDALCIIQDDEVDMAFQIAQMDVIYARAALTVIAGFGDSCEAGLPHIYGKRRDVSLDHIQISEDFGLAMEPYFGPFEKPIEPCRWKHRGWTYQELLLSRRAVLFLKDQVYWKCECSFWVEDFSMEPCGLNEPETFVDLEDCFQTFQPVATAKFCLGQFPQLVWNYWHDRELTYAEDIKKAFVGIQKRMEFVGGLTFHWGLPRVPFDKALAWTNSTSAKPREISSRVALDDGCYYEVPIPSWSWMAWSPLPCYSPSPWPENDEELLQPEEYRVLEFYSVSIGGKYAPISIIRHLDEHKEEKMVNWHETIKNSSKPAPCWMEDNRNVPYVLESQDFHDSGHIAFWTSCARVRIGRNVVEYMTEEKSEKHKYISEPFAVVDSQSNCIGYYSNYGGVFFPEGGFDLDLIVVTRDRCSDGQLELMDDLSLGEEDTGSKGDKYDVEVMEVEWIDQAKGIAKKRAGGGWIYEGTWMQLDREWKFVTLH